ncbi:MAG: FecR/PupR family sigma factor regulator [Pseudomonadota bacterium]
MPGWKTPCDERAALESQALAWIVRLTSGEATLEDAEAFRRWRGQSLAHARALAEMARV